MYVGRPGKIMIRSPRIGLTSIESNPDQDIFIINHIVPSNIPYSN